VNDNEHQAQKDKCTTEQFWFTATILAVNAFLLTTLSRSQDARPYWSQYTASSSRCMPRGSVWIARNAIAS